MGAEVIIGNSNHEHEKNTYDLSQVHTTVKCTF
jgi:hypothetical protein